MEIQTRIKFWTFTFDSKNWYEIIWNCACTVCCFDFKQLDRHISTQKDGLKAAVFVNKPETVSVAETSAFDPLTLWSVNWEFRSTMLTSFIKITLSAKQLGSIYTPWRRVEKEITSKQTKTPDDMLDADCGNIRWDKFICEMLLHRQLQRFLMKFAKSNHWM